MNRDGLRRAGAMAALASGLSGCGYWLYVLVVRGALTVDLGVGRRTRPLGPIDRRVKAEPSIVFDVIAAPYLGRTPKSLSDKLDVLERGSDMVLAAHRTRVSKRVTATTVETVSFERPHRIGFRLVRGPVPFVEEVFELRDADGQTDFHYEGRLGTDLWGLGAMWGARVAKSWEKAVEASLDGIQAEAERRKQVRGD